MIQKLSSDQIPYFFQGVEKVAFFGALPAIGRGALAAGRGIKKAWNFGRKATLPAHIGAGFVLPQRTDAANAIQQQLY